ncbi:MAG: hypothetical protein PVH95_01780 [Anaerolineae bacterium]
MTTSEKNRRANTSTTGGETGTSDPPPRSLRGVRLLAGLCLVVSLLSLALSAMMLYSLLNVRQIAVEGLDAAIAAVDSFGEQGYEYEFPIEQKIPISADIPIEQEMTFPVEGTFPVNTTVEVPINAGILGTFVVEVPIETSIDVETSVPIRVKESFHIETSVPISMTVPIEIRPDDPQLVELLTEIRQWLERVKESL